MLTKPFNYVYQSGRRVNDEYEIKILPNEHVRKIKSKFLHDYSAGFIGLMCPRCFNYDIIKIRNQFARYDTQSSLIYKTPVDTIVDVKYKLNCPICGRTDNFIEVDPNIIKTISILNQKGYYTKYCCEGHDNSIYRIGYIYFKSSDIKEYIHTLPLTWYLDTQSNVPYMGDGCVIRIIDSPYKVEAMNDILEWVKSLPPNKLKNPYQMIFNL